MVQKQGPPPKVPFQPTWESYGNRPVHVIHHHKGHALWGLHTSPFEKALVLVMDGQVPSCNCARIPLFIAFACAIDTFAFAAGACCVCHAARRVQPLSKLLCKHDGLLRESPQEAILLGQTRIPPHFSESFSCCMS